MKKMAELLFEELRIGANASSLSDILNDFNRGEVGVLSYLTFDKEMASAGELSNKLNVTTARIASILNSLENKGFIKRKIDEFDKRKTLVVITSKGKELVLSTKDEIINKIVRVIKEVGIEEVKNYVLIALKIRKILEED